MKNTVIICRPPSTTISLFPVASGQTVTHIGCFIDAGSRDLPHRLWESDEMTIQACVSHCHGYNYAGLQVTQVVLVKYKYR